jgi:hypothetical protein
MTDHLRHLSRRSVNAFLAGAAVWPCNMAALQLAANKPDPPKSLQHILLSLFENPRSAYAIGTACLKSLPPNQSSLQQLTNTFLAAAECDTGTMKTKQAVRQRIANRVRDDFAEGTVVSIEGWLLSLTEARLYALVALCVKSTMT